VHGFGTGGQLICGPCAAGTGGGCDVATTTRVGQWCVDNFIHSAKNYNEASLACHNLGKSICPIEALMLCDVLGSALGTQASCVVTTDNSTMHWTADYDAAYGNSVFAGIVVFGQDNKSFKAAVTELFPFYCCEEVD
jgi:hypothetical protein